MVRTERGRVVYDRKLHPFTISDMVRIGKSLADISTLPENALGFNEILQNYFEEETVDFGEWLDWLDIAINIFATVLTGPHFKIRGRAVKIKGWRIDPYSHEELVKRYAVTTLRSAATTIEGVD